MNSFVVISIFAAAAIFQMAAAVNVTVFYESLCPDSMRFIRKQLYPTYQSLGDYINVEFVPFGKAYYTVSPWRISCQHGPNECLGNAVQACALAKYHDSDMQVNFISCVMSDYNPPSAGPKCAKKLNYSYDGIEECSKNNEGRQLMIKYGERTRDFRERLSFVPTVLFDDKYTKRDQDDALYSLRSVVCRKIEPKPVECNGY